MQIKINYYMLEDIQNDMQKCKTSIETMQDALSNLETLYSQSEGEAVESLRMQKAIMIRQLDYYYGLFTDLEDLFRGYIEETKAYLTPCDPEVTMIVDAPSLKRAIEAIEQEVNGLTGSQNTIGIGDMTALDPVTASQDHVQNIITYNQGVADSIRSDCAQAQARAREKIQKLWALYNDHFLPFVEKDEEYGRKALEMAHKYSDSTERFNEFMGDVRTNVGDPLWALAKSAGNAAVDMVKFFGGVAQYAGAAIVDETPLPRIHRIGDWKRRHFDDVNSEIAETAGTILKNPKLLWETITDSVSYELAEEGALCGGAAIVGSFIPDLLGTKGITKVSKAGRLKELKELGVIRNVESLRKVRPIHELDDYRKLQNELIQVRRVEGTSVRAMDDIAVKPRTFTSTDPMVGETASTIENALPGVVKDVNVPIRNPELGLSSDADIMLKNGDVIEIKSGGGKGATTQVTNQSQIVGSSGEVIVYGPNLKPSVINGIQNAGTKVFNNIDDLLSYIKSKGGY